MQFSGMFSTRRERESVFNQVLQKLKDNGSYIEIMKEDYTEIALVWTQRQIERYNESFQCISQQTLTVCVWVRERERERGVGCWLYKRGEWEQLKAAQMGCFFVDFYHKIDYFLRRRL